MKKLKIYLILPLAAVGLFSSSCGSNSKIALVYGQYNATNFTDIDYQKLSEMVADKETLILAVEPDVSCACWTNFKPIATNYISKTGAIIYHMKYGMFKNKDTFNISLKEGYTSFAIFNKGVVSQTFTSDNSILKNEDEFNKYMESVVYLPHFFYINLEQLKHLASLDEKNVIYFSRSGCGDCSYVNKNFLNEYATTHVEQKNMYIIDCDKMGMTLYDENHNPTQEWIDFKQNWGLGSKINADYGYSSGYVPTFLQLSGSNNKLNFYSGAVYFNDTIAYENGQYIVKESYYSNDRVQKLEYLKDYNGTKVLQNLNISESEVSKYGESYYWNQDAAAKYHNPLLEQFLNYYLKK